jgi:hypothetical protein
MASRFALSKVEHHGCDMAEKKIASLTRKLTESEQEILTQLILNPSPIYVEDLFPLKTLHRYRRIFYSSCPHKFN